MSHHAAGAGLCNSSDAGAPALKIQAFYLRLALSAARRLPRALTLVYYTPPTAAGLEINGSAVIPCGGPALLSLHRCRPEECGGGDGVVVFASTDVVVTAGEGVKFEAYVREKMVVEGVFRRKRRGGGEGWEMEWRCVAEVVGDVDVRVVGGSGGVWGRWKEGKERDRATARRRWKRSRSGRFFSTLEDIPEERELEEMEEPKAAGSSAAEEEVMLMAPAEGVEEEESWPAPVDVGLLAMCLGMGLLVFSKASFASRYNSARKKSSLL